VGERREGGGEQVEREKKKRGRGRLTFGDELAVDFGRMAEFRQDDHALADVFAPDALQGEGGRLAGGADGDGDAFAFDGADGGRRELAEGVGPDEDGVAGVDEACGLWLS